MNDVRLSDQQYQIMAAVIRLGNASVKQVQEDLQQLNLAYTTVATVLTRLEKRGLLESTLHGRVRCYSSKVNDASIKRSMVDSLVSTAFTSNPLELVAYLVQEGEFSPEELDDLKAIIAKNKHHD